MSTHQGGGRIYTYSINEGQAGQRLDNFLFTQLKNFPKSGLYRLIRKKNIRINGKRTQADYRLQADDELRVGPIAPPQEVVRHQPPAHYCQQVKSSILYEDDRLVVLNKMSGQAVHAGSGVDFGVIDAMQHLGYKGVQLAHRLDRDTSGCLILAKNRTTLLAVHQLLQAGAMQKSYLALLHGACDWQQTVTNDKLIKKVNSGRNAKMGVSEQGKTSQTIFERLSMRDNATLVKAILVTGRTHQIRVHAAQMGHPIVGDIKYGDRQLDRMLAPKSRLWLHALQCAFTLDGHAYRFKAPLSGRLQRTLEQLEIESFCDE